MRECHRIGMVLSIVQLSTYLDAATGHHGEYCTLHIRSVSLAYSLGSLLVFTGKSAFSWSRVNRRSAGHIR